MGEAKRRKELGISPREVKKTKESVSETNQINKILSKYPYLPIILGLTLFTILIFDLVNFYK